MKHKSITGAIIAVLALFAVYAATHESKSGRLSRIAKSEYADDYKRGFSPSCEEGSDGFYWELTRFRYPDMPEHAIDDYIFMTDTLFAEKYYDVPLYRPYATVYTNQDILYIHDTWDYRVYISSESGKYKYICYHDEASVIIEAITAEHANKHME